MAGSSTVAGSQGQHKKPGAKRGQRDQVMKPTKFKQGRCEELAGYIYDYAGDKQAADQYTKTMREICKYVISLLLVAIV